MNRHFWAREASAARESLSSPHRSAIEELPAFTVKPDVPTASDFFGMESGSVADDELPSAAASRPEIPPAEVPVTRAMSVVSGTVRAFGSDVVRQLGGYQPLHPLPPIGGPPGDEETDTDERGLMETGDAPSVAQTLETEAHRPAQLSPGPPPADEPPPGTVEPTMPFRRPPRRDLISTSTAGVQSARKRRRRTSPNYRMMGIVGVLLFVAAVVGGALLIQKQLTQGSPVGDVPSDAVTRPVKGPVRPLTPTPAPRAEPTPDAEGEAVAGEGEGEDASEGEGESEGAGAGEGESSAVEGESSAVDTAAAPVEGITPGPGVEAIAAVEPPEPSTPPVRVEPGTPRPAREPPVRRETRTSSPTPAPVATQETGVLHLSARPRCRVEIDDVPYGTTDTTRRGIDMPPGTYRVRFVCDDPVECAGFKRRAGTKTLKVEAGKETRYIADFYKLNLSE
jgi:hypothetical protein